MARGIHRATRNPTHGREPVKAAEKASTQLTRSERATLAIALKLYGHLGVSGILCIETVDSLSGERTLVPIESSEGLERLSQKLDAMTAKN
jgi:hypothetical protein